MFNYSTGPVELDARVKGAMRAAPSSSHSSAGQRLVRSTLALLREVLGVPADFEVFMLPGSIRQALDSVLGAISGPEAPVLAYTNGYWGDFMAGLLDAAGHRVQRANPLRPPSFAEGGLVTAVHMETETGFLQPLDHLRHHRAAGLTVVLDAACTVPVHPIDYGVVDVLVLGSHKCLGAAPGLGIVVARDTVRLTRSWSVDAYWRDADSADRARLPLVTYPTSVVASLEASLRLIGRDPDFRAARAEAAYALRAALSALGFTLHLADGAPSDTVTRIDLPPEIDVEEFRHHLATAGFFVIGNVGASSGSSIRVGTMSSPQVALDNVHRLIAALDQARTSVTRISTERV